METIHELVTIEEKQRHWPLLFLADPDRDMVMKYLVRGRMFVMSVDGEAASEVVTAVRDDGQLEMMNLATDPRYQRRGYAGRLIRHVRDEARGRYDRLYVGTAFPGLYERWGFEYAYTVPNFFVDNYPEPIVDEGRQCVDMIYYVMDL